MRLTVAVAAVAVATGVAAAASRSAITNGRARRRARRHRAPRMAATCRRKVPVVQLPRPRAGVMHAAAALASPKLD